ncbi:MULTISPECIES: methyl-accepting chemotaxis protein [Nitrincola]|uniref:Methyl-accepting chemotaxis protein 4 n=1 Tax=Nitrincola nitratireducens TaxID=1229521 RepID=W9VFL2_9GAMM|nr:MULTISPECIES: methyl-accepting chemotaxis protein [Nitrincola]EXJ09470.1 Methyl-accepting chemotaxis protein 4 [Nitrincola nitratireducens]
MLIKMKLRTRMLILIALIILGLSLLTLTSILSTQRDLTQGRKDVITAVLESAYSIAEFYHSKERDGSMSREDAQQATVAAFLAGRYGGLDGKTEYVYAWTMDGVGVAHVNPNFIGQNMMNQVRDVKGRYTLQDISSAARQSPKGAFVDSLFPRPGTTEAVEKLQFTKMFEPWDWFIGTGIYMDDLAADMRKQIIADISTALIIITLITALALLIARSVLRQIGGEPADAIRFMASAAAGNLTIKIDQAPKHSVLDELAKMVASLRDTMNHIRDESARVNGNANTINQATANVASAAYEQSEAITSMAAAIEEMTVSISHISDSARDTEDSSKSSAQLAEQGVQQVALANTEIHKIAKTVREASTKVENLNNRATQISSIAGVIRDIAEQTNLLALNAAIEAARAGDQGRGFAVVADEVRTLAGRTANATSDIEAMIAGVLTETGQVVDTMKTALPQVESGVSATETASQILAHIKQESHSTLKRISEVANATREQGLASSSIAEKVDQIAAMVESTSQAMRATAESVHELNQVSSELNTMVNRFQCH